MAVSFIGGGNWNALRKTHMLEYDRQSEINVRENEGVVQNGQFKDPGKIAHEIHGMKTKETKNTTQNVGHHLIDNINKT